MRPTEPITREKFLEARKLLARKIEVLIRAYYDYIDPKFKAQLTPAQNMRDQCGALREICNKVIQAEKRKWVSPLQKGIRTKKSIREQRVEARKLIQHIKDPKKLDYLLKYLRNTRSGTWR